MGPGTVMAIARYRLRTDYQNNLSTDPPAKEDVEKNITLSFSEPIDVASIPSDTPLQLVFDFSADPIAAGITDLYVMVIFHGQMEGVEDPIAAIGFKDLYEPHHILRWNNTDWFFIDNQWLTSTDIRASSPLMDFVDENCWYMEPYIDPMDIELFVGFSAEQQDAPVYVVHYQNIPPGRFGRLIALSDAEQIWMHARSVTHSPDDTLDWTGVMPVVIIQMDPTGFTSTIPYTTRGIVTHSSVGWSWTCPAVSSISWELTEEFNAKPAASNKTVPVTDLTFPQERTRETDDQHNRPCLDVNRHRPCRCLFCQPAVIGPACHPNQPRGRHGPGICGRGRNRHGLHRRHRGAKRRRRHKDQQDLCSGSSRQGKNQAYCCPKGRAGRQPDHYSIGKSGAAATHIGLQSIYCSLFVTVKIRPKHRQNPACH